MKSAVPSRTHKEPSNSGPTSRFIVESSKAVSYLSTYRKLLAKLAAVFLGTAALVGIATIKNAPEVSVVTAVPTRTEIIQAAKPEAPVASEPATEPITGPTIQTAPVTGDFGFSLGSPDQSIPTPPSIKSRELLTAPNREATPSLAPPAVAEASQPSPDPITARKEYVEIAVQLTIQDGRVAQAQVENRHPGAEAFAATALHIARQRRYPPGTSRTETVVVRVANQFGRKEP